MKLFCYILAFVGFMQRGPFFFRLWYAFGGYWIGSVIDSFLFSRVHSFKHTARQQSQQSLQLQLLQAQMTAFAHIIHADGRIMHSEMEALRHFLRQNYSPSLQQKGEDIILALFKEKKAMSSQAWQRQLAIQCQLLAMYLAPDSRVTFLQLLIIVANADGHLAQEEYLALKYVATYMGLGASIIDQLLNNQSHSHTARPSSAEQLAQDYQTLDLKPDATAEQVKKAYRQLALKYHPDKLNNQPEAQRRQAAEQFVKITEAKDRILNALNARQGSSR